MVKSLLAAAVLSAALAVLPAAAGGDSWRPVKLTVTLAGVERPMEFRFEYGKGGDISRIVVSGGGPGEIEYWFFEYSADSYVISVKNGGNETLSGMKYTHDKSGRTMEQVKLGADNAPLGRERYFYEGGLMSRVEVFNADGKLVETRRLEYANGLLFRMEMRETGGSLLGYVLFEHDAKGRRSSFSHHGGDGSLLFRSVYEYGKGKLTARAAEYLAY